jgi:hypothetical protein
VARILDNHIYSSRDGTLSHGRTLAVLVHNVLVARDPLYRLSEWLEPIDPQALGLSGREKRAINDDRVGRALEQLAEFGGRGVFFQLALRSIKLFKRVLPVRLQSGVRRPPRPPRRAPDGGQRRFAPLAGQVRRQARVLRECRARLACATGRASPRRRRSRGFLKAPATRSPGRPSWPSALRAVAAFRDAPFTMRPAFQDPLSGGWPDEFLGPRRPRRGLPAATHAPGVVTRVRRRVAAQAPVLPSRARVSR